MTNLHRPSSIAHRITQVAAAVIHHPDGRVLLAQRPPGKPYEGYWEFPGGKLEPGETAAHALARELHEELGLDVVRAAPWITQEYVYPHAHVLLHFFRVLSWRGEPHGHDGQAFAWQWPGRFDVAPLLPANTRVLAALALPTVYGITCAADMGEDAFLQRARDAMRDGLRLVQIREKTWPLQRRNGFAKRLAELARPYEAKLLLNGNDVDAVRSLGLAGVHWTSADLAQATARPRDMMVAASCHTHDEIVRAAQLEIDFAVLGPVRATPTHPDAALLGWDGFAARIVANRLPVYALGGLTHADLDDAIDHGAHGIALRRAAWPPGP
ncbi:MAG TPA: Nudix family hydrolase [Casimicrobiaceae bacterium]|nr:Nudix family hydrolase [Casimicrobiaceae bacterium]